MDWPEYKALCERPNVLPRAMLVRTEALLSAALADVLRRARAGVPLSKPADHKGGSETDMFEVLATPAQAKAIVQAVEAAAATGCAGHGVVAAWRDLLRHVAGATAGGEAIATKAIPIRSDPGVPSP